MGIKPLSALLDRSSVLRLERWPHELGRNPPRLLPARFNVVRLDKLPTPAGKVPDNPRSGKLRVVRAVRFCSEFDSQGVDVDVVFVDARTTPETRQSSQQMPVQLHAGGSERNLQSEVLQAVVPQDDVPQGSKVEFQFSTASAELSSGNNDLLKLSKAAVSPGSVWQRARVQKYTQTAARIQ